MSPKHENTELANHYPQSYNTIFMFVHTEPETTKSPASVSSDSAAGLLEHSAQLVEILTNVSSVLELLSRAAQTSLDEQQRQVEQIASFLTCS